MTSALQVVLNVDDLGLHPAVRRAVEECAARGTITSASVMANGPDIVNVRETAGVSLGAHLNILRGRPLSPPSEVKSLLDEQGHFIGSWARFVTRLLQGGINLAEVRLEWSRQVVSIRERGLSISHLDGEKHTHCIPPLFAIACEVAAEHNIPFVRLSAERYGNTHFGVGFLRRAVLNAMCERSQIPASVRVADSVWGIAEQGRKLKPSAFAHALHQRTRGLVEIVCHPGRVHRGDPGFPPSFGRMRVTELWEPELRTLLEDPWRETADEQGWILTGFDRVA